MARLVAHHVGLEFPVYNARSLSLRNQLIQLGTGGLLRSQRHGPVVVSALRDVSFSLNDGDTIGLVGHNGAGKSSLLRLLAGIYPPTAGYLERDGSIATLFEVGAGIETELTGYENVVRVGMLHGLSSREARSLIPEIENFTDLGDYMALPVRTYSSGMMMRLAFGVATAILPNILLVDEIIGTGDAKFQSKASERVEQMMDRASILVLASHSAQTVERFCRKAILLEHGETIAFDDVDIVLKEYASRPI